jgi:hypothetical protein
MSITSDAVVGSPVLRTSFVVVTIFLGALFAAAVYWSARRTGLERRVALRRGGAAAALAAGWIALTGVAGARGVLHFEAPPTMLVAILGSIVMAIALGLSPVGKRIAVGVPLAALVGYQGFRVAVELMMHRAYSEGLMPVQMSYSGRNFDIVTGVTAVALGIWLATGQRAPRLVVAWNTLGVLLLVNILAVALLSAPTPLRVFMNEPANVWIARAPWVWLPTVMVFAAIVGHVVVYRRLSRELAPVAGSRL